MPDSRATPLGAGERLFGGLGRAVHRHPWYPIIFWIVLLVVALPFLSRISAVTQNSATNLPSSAPSTIASDELSRLFPNISGGSTSFVLLLGYNVTTPLAQRAIENVTLALQSDKSLPLVSSVDSAYTAAAGYLAGEAELASGVIQAALLGTPALLPGINESALLLWGPPAAYVATWESLVAANPSTPPARWNSPAVNETGAMFASNPPALLVLSAFYNGTSGDGRGFNGTANCASTPSAVVACADSTARLNEAPLLPSLFPIPSESLLGSVVLDSLAIENYTAWPSVLGSGSAFLNLTSGAPFAWIRQVWSAFPLGISSLAVASQWTAGLVANATLDSLPLPIPKSVVGPYLDSSRTAAIIAVSYSVGSGYTNSSGGNPVFADVREVNRLVPTVLVRSNPTVPLQFYQTGGAALDEFEQSDLNRNLAIVLPLTVLVLILITILYFRAPIAPAVTFGGLGIALTLGLGGVVLIGTFVTKVDPTAITLMTTFVLGVGTDYSIFLVARYREELIEGKSSEDALVKAVTWAGQSVATSGSTAIIATLALALSGVSLLSQWGTVLSLAIFVTVVLSLTLVPAFLALLGPRMFWPATGARFQKLASRIRTNVRDERTYFHRAGRLTQRRSGAILLIIAVISIPLVLLALLVPLSYDFYQQLPPGHPATQGLSQLDRHFGPGFAFPAYALVTFSAPLITGNQTNAAEFTELAMLSSTAQTTSGIASVASPVGPPSASLSTWIRFANQTPVTQTNLKGLLAGFVGSDGRTVFVSLQTTASGLSLSAVDAVDSVRSAFHDYVDKHPEVANLAFGGGAPVTRDLAAQTLLSTERMILAVSVGLVLVLLVVLRSWVIPVMAVATIGISIAWSWSLTYLVFGFLYGLPLFFFVPTVLFILILGLGIDYNIFLLTRVREERLKGASTTEATVEAVARTGGIITAAAVILASAFAVLVVGDFTLLRAIGFSVAAAVLLDAAIVRTYLVPAALHRLGDRVWSLFSRRRRAESAPPSEGAS